MRALESSSCFIFLFDIPEDNEINEQMLKKATVCISWEIWCSNRETGRFDEKLGELAGMLTDRVQRAFNCAVTFNRITLVAGITENIFRNFTDHILSA